MTEILNQKKLEFKLKEDDILYFLHIPKTSGTSFISILEDHFDLDSIYPETEWEQLLVRLPEDLSKYRLVRGHYGYYLYRVLMKKPVYITMLREPLSRVVSQFQQTIRNNPEEYKDFFSRGGNFSDFIKDPNKKWRLENLQVRYIALDRDVLSWTNPYYMNNENGILWPAIILELKSPHEKSDKELCKIAKSRLTDFPFFGLQERFNESLLLLCYTFGWFPTREIRSLNAAPKDSAITDLSKDTIKIATGLNKWDIELYNYAKQLFDSRFAQMVKELQEKYYEPKFANMTFHDMLYVMLEKHFISSQYNIKKKKNFIDYKFSQSIIGSGWHQREIASYNTSFRWTGSTQSVIYFSLDRTTNLKIRFRVILSISEKILNSLSLKVDDIPISLSIMYMHQGRIFYEGIIPKLDPREEKPLTKLIFQVSHTVSPRSINREWPDDRMLGVAIDWLKITPHNN